MTGETKPKDIAAWMMGELDRYDGGPMPQQVVAVQILDKFGEEYTYINSSGNLAICKPVLDAFRKASGDDVVWSRTERHWRCRQDWDVPGRQQP